MSRFDTPEERRSRVRADLLKPWVRKGVTVISLEDAGQRLDRYLAHRFTYRSRTQWRELVRSGRMTLNGKTVRASRILREGDHIAYVPLERAEPPIDRGIRILHRDPHIVAVAKSGNLPIHPSGRYFRHTLLHLLTEEYAEDGPYYVVHRLDRETSGLVLFGRTREATAHLARQFRRREIRKRYLALVEGQPEEPSFRIDLPLGRAENSRIRKAVGVREDGVGALTQVELIHQGDGWAWVEARPLTGRLHQIRVHLRAAGLPILGDKVYGQSEEFFLKLVADDPLTPEEEAILGFGRQALHAYELTLQHPHTEEPMTLKAPLPEDLAGELRRRGLDPSPWC